MKIFSAIRRYAIFACSLIALLGLATPAFATHLRGGTLTWRVTGTTSTTYTVQFTLNESQRWSYPNSAGSCVAPVPGSTTACAPLGTVVDLVTFTGTGSFAFGDGTTGDATGTITSINQAQDYATVTFTFTHNYNISAGAQTASFTATNRISTLQLGHDDPEVINAYVQNYPNGAPVAAMPAILSVPLQSSATFNLATAVTDIDPNVNLVYRLSTPTEMYGGAITCPSGITYTQGGVPSGNPPGFTVTSAGVVTWNTTQIQPAITGANCGFAAPKAGDLWPAQVMVEAVNKSSGALITQAPIDILMQFINPVGVLPTIALSPAGTQTVAIGTPVAFTATGSSGNANAKVTLNASGIPSGATASGLNAAVTPPTTSNFNWTPGPGQDGTYVITYTVTDNNLQQATASNTVVVATLPTISCAAPINITSGQTGTLTSTVFDINQDPLNVAWAVDGTNAQTNSNVTAYPNPGTVQFQYSGPGGVHSVKVTATDPHGVAVSCTTSVTVYQRTVLALASASGTAGGTVPLSATLTTSPDGLPVPNQMVTFSFAGTGAPSPVGAVTDANGVATVPVVFTTPGSFAATATFSNPSGYFTDPAGDIPPVADTATAPVTVAKATASLSALTVVPSNALVGSPLTVSTTLSQTSAPVGAATGAIVQFSYTAPGGGDTQIVITDANGLASWNFTPTQAGVYSITAQFAGNVALLGTTPTNASVTVYQRTSLALAPPASGTAGSAVTLSATLTNVPSGTSLAGQTVTFDFGGVISQATAVTSASGVATVSVVFPSAGTFPVTASFFNTGGFFADSTGNLAPDTATGTATIQAATTSLSALNPPSITFIGSPITVSTTLSRVSAPSGAVNGATVTFTFTAPGGAVTTLNGLTDSNGLASASFTPTTGGAYSIAASFAGNAALLPVTSSVASVSVYQETSLAMPPVSGTAGNPLSVSATLTNIPSGTPLAGQTVTFSFGGGINNATATTDANGVATVVVTFPAAGTFSATASFQNVAGFFANSNGSITATTVASQVTVALATTSLSNLNYPLANVVGNTMTLSTTLTRLSAPGGPVSGVPVAFVYSVSGAAPVTLPAATTDANGMASVNFTPTTPGTYAFSAMFAGTNGLAASQVTGPVVSVYQRTSLALASASGTAGSSVTLSATLTAIPGGVPLTNQLVTFSFSGTGAPSPLTAMTNSIGVATVQPVFTTAGSFTATAAFSNPAGFFTDSSGSFPPAATTASAPVTVTQIAQTINIQSPADVNYGSSITLVASGGASGNAVVWSILSGTGATLNGNVLTATSGVGSVLLAANQAGNTNYSAAPTAQWTVKLHPAPLTVTAANASSVFGSTPGPFSGTIAGIVNNDAITATYATTATASSNAGTYSIVPTPSGAALSNYTVTINNGTLTVTQATQIINIQSPADVNYGSSITLVASGGASGNAVVWSILSGTGATLNGNVLTATSGVGSVLLAANQAGNTNYSAAPTAQWTVKLHPAPLTVTAANASSVFGSTPGPFSGTIAGIVNNDAITATYATTATASSNAGTYSIVPTPSGAALSNYTVTINNGTLTVTQATQIINIQSLADVNYGSSITLVASGGASGNAVVWSILSGTGATLNGNVLTATSGVGSVLLAANQAGSTDYSAAPAAQWTVRLHPAPLTVTAANASSVFGSTPGPFSGTIAGIVNNDAITATYATTATASSNAGTYSIVPTPSGAALSNYTVTINNGTLTVTQATQIINIQSLADVNYGSSITLVASGGASGNAVVWSILSGTGATLNGNVLTATSGVGSVLLAANQAGSTDYSAAPAAQWTVRLHPAPLTVTAANASSVFGSTPGPFSGTIAGIVNNDAITATYATTATASSNAGTYSIVPTPSGAALSNYTVTINNGTLTVTQATQIINIQSLADVNYGSSITLVASGGASGNAVVWSILSGTGATLNGNVLTATSGVGSVLLAANQAGSTDYSAAPTAQWTVRLHPAPLTASIINTPHKTYDGTTSVTLTNANFQLSGLVGTDAFNVNTATGTFASADVGMEQVSATIGATDLMPATGTTTLLVNYVLPTTATGQGRIDAAGQLIMFTQPASPVVFGVTPIMLTATGGASNNPVTFKVVSGPGAISGNTLTVNGAGTIVIAADQAGSTDYTAAPEVTQTVTVNPATPQLGFMPTGITYGTTLAVNQIDPSATGVAGAVLTDAGSFTYNPALGTELKAGTDSVTVTFTPTDTTDYTTATGNVSIKVSADQPTLALSSTPITYGTGFAPSQINAVATGPDGAVAGTLSFTVTAGTVLAAGTNTIGVTFTPTDNSDFASVSGNVSLLVNPATLTVTAKNQSQVYGHSANLTPQEGTTFTYSGFMHGESSSVLTGAPALTTTETTTSLPTDANGHPITYPITINKGSLSSSNYAFTFIGAQDTVLATGTVPANGNCAGVYQGGTYNGNINVGPNQVCILISNTVTGNIQQTGGIVEVIQTTLVGNFQINGQQANGNTPAPATSFQVTGGSNIQGNLQIQHLPVATAANQVCGSTIKGDFQYQQNGAPVLIGSALPSDNCAGNNIGGNLEIQQNTATVSAYNNVVGNNLQAQNNTAPETITYNTINGNLQVQNNTAATTVNNNTVKGDLQDAGNTASTAVNNNSAGGNLQCQSNSTITGGGNTAKSKQGQCAAF